MADRSRAAEQLARDPRTDASAERDELQRELDRRGAEILRLRDLLLVKDAELGAVRGRLAELENLSRGLITAVTRIQRFAPWLLSLAGALRRRLRARSERSGSG